MSVVAKSRTGKTTLLERLIPLLREAGMTVGVMKHHVHAQPFDVPGKDTFRLSDAGADLVVGVSPVQIATFRSPGRTSLDEIIDAAFGNVDIVLTEGYKRGSYPKIEVHREARSRELLCSGNELLAVATDENLSVNVPQFHIDDTASIAEFLVRWCVTR